MKQETWSINFQRSVGGWVLVSARRKGGKLLQGLEIPARIRDWAHADARGMIKDLEANEVIQRASRDGFKATLTSHDIAAMKRVQPAPPMLDWDEASYVGDGNDGVYYGAMFQNGSWWALATVDSNTGGFTDTLTAERGYRSERAALAAARDAALEWCHVNRVPAQR